MCINSELEHRTDTTLSEIINIDLPTLKVIRVAFSDSMMLIDNRMVLWWAQKREAMFR